MYALVTYDGYALDVVDGPLDEAVARARALGAREVIPDESYDLAQLFEEDLRQAERAANPVKWLRNLEKAKVIPLRPPRPRRLAVLPTSEELTPGAAKAVDDYYRTGKFPRGVTKAQALEILRHLGPAGRLQAAGLFRELDPRRAPETAWSASNRIHISLDKVLSMDPKEAFERVAQFRAPRLRPGDRLPKRWTSLGRFMVPIFDRESGLPSILGLLSTNHKMKKSSKFGGADVMGLSILPHKLWQLGFSGDNPKRGIFNACVGASPECAQACLVYSGQNTEQANEVKATRMDAFVREPIAFARILMISIEMHRRDARVFQKPRLDGYVPFVRLNVFSDLPWELIFPELFDYFPEISFYDYTKVPGRERTIADAGITNYDLTFSWSGVNANSCEWTWDRGGRVAMVFFKTAQEHGFWRTHEYWRGRQKARSGVPMGPMPHNFFGMEVIDGDITDVRPYDYKLARGTPPWIVGLRYKPPKGQAFDKLRSLFVVPVEEREGVIFAAVVPRDQPGTLEAQLREAADIMALERAEAAVLAKPPSERRTKARLTTVKNPRWDRRHR